MKGRRTRDKFGNISNREQVLLLIEGGTNILAGSVLLKGARRPRRVGISNWVRNLHCVHYCWDRTRWKFKSIWAEIFPEACGYEQHTEKTSFGPDMNKYSLNWCTKESDISIRHRAAREEIRYMKMYVTWKKDVYLILTAHYVYQDP